MFDYFIEGPLLKIVLAVFFIGIFYRFICFVYVTLSQDMGPYAKIKGRFLNIIRLFIPFHKGISKNFLYGTVRFIFHLCLIIVPVWFYGHIELWEESRWGWSWNALPDAWIDGMTIVLLVLSCFFIIRRFAVPVIRRDSTVSDYALILITAIPFLTGMFLTHGEGLDAIRTIHVLSGELLLLVVLFLLVRVRFIEKRCTGCAACVLECPSGALNSKDENKSRLFSFKHYQCIHCGNCVSVCPEDASGLRHAISLQKLFKPKSRDAIRTVELAICDGCGEPLAPNPQVIKVAQDMPCEFTNLCNRCKMFAAITADQEKIAVPLNANTRGDHLSKST
jgi:formate hydrogenlyase subunit 6/NADH:ubiquinone oxidoreductase subunit I